MTGAQHYAEAQRLLEGGPRLPMTLLRALVHAVLALAYACATDGEDLRYDE